MYVERNKKKKIKKKTLHEQFMNSQYYMNSHKCMNSHHYMNSHKCMKSLEVFKTNEYSYQVRNCDVQYTTCHSAGRTLSGT